MRKDFGAQTWLFPMPVLIIGTYNEDGSPNAMNAAWGGIHDTNQIGVCIDPGHKTAENLQKKGLETLLRKHKIKKKFNFFSNFYSKTGERFEKRVVNIMRGYEK